MASSGANSGHQGNIKHPDHDGRLKENREAGRTMGTTPGSRERQETGGHASESRSGEHRASEHRTSERDSGAKGHETASRSGGGDDLKSREYKDADGNVHHHTRSYEEQHRNEK